MARIFQEFFEAAGYDEAGWSENVTGGSSVNEDFATTPGFPAGWGNQCLRVDHVTVTEATAINNVGSTPISFTAFEVIVLSADTGGGLLGGAIDSTAALVLWAATLANIGGVPSINLIVVDGAAQFAFAEPLVVGVPYRFEIKYDTTNDLWAAWVNNVACGNGSISGAYASAPLTFLLFGAGSADAGVYSALFDKIEVDDAERVYPNKHAFGSRTRPRAFGPGLAR